MFVTTNQEWLKRTHANFHYIVAEISRIAITLEIARCVSAGSVPAHSAHDLAFVDVCAKKNQVQTLSTAKNSNLTIDLSIRSNNE